MTVRLHGAAAPLSGESDKHESEASEQILGVGDVDTAARGPSSADAGLFETLNTGAEWSDPPGIMAPLAKVGGDASYVPRRLLSLPPRAVAPIVVGYPEGVAALEHARLVLSLFIDETGEVNRVRVDEGLELPQSLQDAASSAFLEARFQPGEREQQAVKAHVRVEVLFDAGASGSR